MLGLIKIKAQSND